MSAPEQGLRRRRRWRASLLAESVEVETPCDRRPQQPHLAGARGTTAFALKQYPSRRDDPRDRLATEVGALRLMEHYHVGTVPRVIGVDSERGYALLSWIDGTEVAEVADRDIDAAVEFLESIHRLRDTPWAVQQPLAAEACL